MSPLTKLFVGLLVVLSLLLTASTVTFVNTLDNQRQKAQLTEQQLQGEKDRDESLLAQASSDSAGSRRPSDSPRARSSNSSSSRTSRRRC